MEMKSEQTVAEPVKSATITRWRHGKRASSKVMATELRGIGWHNLGNANKASITIANQEAAEAYVIELDRATLKELVKIYDGHQSAENKIGRTKGD